MLILTLCFLFTSVVFGQENGNYNRIVGGRRTTIDKQPYQVALFSIFNPNSILCGGSIIGPKWILTAGHCCNTELKLLVKAGMTNICNTKFIASSKRLITHPEFNMQSSYNSDICLVELQNELTLGYNNIDKIELAEYYDRITPGEAVRVTGWGSNFHGGVSTCDLYGININIIEKPVCDAAYGILDTHFCAGVQGGRKDSCQGDSGGPLVTMGGKTKQLGIVSFGQGCASARYPGAYTAVPIMRGWIRSISGI